MKTQAELLQRIKDCHQGAKLLWQARAYRSAHKWDALGRRAQRQLDALQARA